MKKKVITKAIIMKVYEKTKQPIGKTQFERIIDWLEFNDYNITTNAYHRICKYMEQRSEICQQIKYINNLK
jgi:uncharacterized protein YozE (UPF0346 family)